MYKLIVFLFFTWIKLALRRKMLRKAVHTICHSKSGEINPAKGSNLVRAYVQRYRLLPQARPQARSLRGPPRHPRSQGPLTKAAQACPCPLSELPGPTPSSFAASLEFWTIYGSVSCPSPVSGMIGGGLLRGKSESPCPVPRPSPRPQSLCPVPRPFVHALPQFH